MGGWTVYFTTDLFLIPNDPVSKVFENAFDVRLYRINASTNTWRYYRFDLQPDLFGLWFLVKEWALTLMPFG